MLDRVYQVVNHCKTNQVIFYGAEGVPYRRVKSVFQSSHKVVLSKKTYPLKNKILYQLLNFSLPKTSDFRPSLPLFQPCVCIYVSHIRRGKIKHSQILVLAKLNILKIKHFSLHFHLPFVSLIQIHHFAIEYSSISRWRCNDFLFFEIRKVLLFGRTSFMKIQNGNVKSWNFFSFSFSFKKEEKIWNFSG